MITVAIVGPESCGKTTLATALASHFHASLVPEFSRTFLEKRGPEYSEKDLLGIAQGQIASEELVARELPALLICDTDLLTIRIWSEEKYGRCHPWIMQHSERRQYDLWLLCKPDLPWEPDPLRENPDDRERLFERYEELLDQLGKPYAVISGAGELRTLLAIGFVEGIVAEGE